MKKVIPLLAAAMLLMFSHSSFGAVPHEEFLSFRNIKDQAWREDNLMTVRSDQIGQGQIVAQLREACGSEDAVHQIQIIVGDITFSAKLYDNQTARAFAEMLPLSLDMKELNGNEKFCYLFGSLPTNSTRPSSIHAGDLMLFSSDCLVLFYESFSSYYSYTPLGYLEDTAGLVEALGRGDVKVTFQAS